MQSTLRKFDFFDPANRKFLAKYNTLLQHKGEPSYKKGFQNLFSSILSTYDCVLFHTSKGEIYPKGEKNALLIKTQDVIKITEYLESKGYKWGGTFLHTNDGFTVIELLENYDIFGKRYRFVQ